MNTLNNARNIQNCVDSGLKKNNCVPYLNEPLKESFYFQQFYIHVKLI